MNAQINTGFFGSIASLRASVAGATPVAIVQDGTIGRAYNWKDASLAVDDSASVIRPNGINPGDPGRWELFANVTLPENATEGYLIEGIPVTFENNRAVVATRPGWVALGMTNSVLWMGLRIVT